MFYIIALVVLLLAVIIVFAVRITNRFIATRKAHHAASQDPENARDLGPRPTLRGTARDVSNIMFPPRERNGDHDESCGHAQYGCSRGQGTRRSHGSAVTRVDSAQDHELPSYQDSAKMPRPPPAVYDPCVAQHTESVTPPAVSAPVAPGVAPPQYTETPIVRVL